MKSSFENEADPLGCAGGAIEELDGSGDAAEETDALGGVAGVTGSAVQPATSRSDEIETTTVTPVARMGMVIH